VKEQPFPPSEIQTAIIIGGITLAARWPVALYTGVLRGLERQVLQNGILSIANTARVFITIVALLVFSKTVYCFLITQAVVNVGEALAMGWVARRLIDPEHIGRFNLEVVRRVWHFALSFNLVGAFGTLVSAADTFLIVKLLPFTYMTYYAVCGTATGVLQVIAQAASLSLFPRLAYTWHQKDIREMNRLYSLNVRLVGYICLGPVMLLWFYAREILQIWTQNAEITENAGVLLPILATAVIFNCASSPAYNVLIATGHTLVPLIVNILAVPIIWAGCYFGLVYYGLPGAATCRLVQESACFLIYGLYCRRKVLQLSTFSLSLGFPIVLLIPALGIGFVSKILLPAQSPAWLVVTWLAVSGVFFYVFGMPFLKQEDRQMILTPIIKVYKSLRVSSS
jgi:O-antigen/teichoic acid export membrane protein